MNLIDKDELLEHVGRDKLDSRELIFKMIEDRPTVNLQTFKSMILSIVKHIKVDAVNEKDVGFATGVACADIEYFDEDFRAITKIDRTKLETCSHCGYPDNSHTVLQHVARRMYGLWHRG